MNTKIFNELESNVRSYCRNFPVVFNRAEAATLYDESGHGYIDFLAGAGALNYGHNDPDIKQALSDYLVADNIIHGLDLHTVAKRDFLQAFYHRILQPRGLDYKIQFCGPTGTNAVEAALKLARKIKKRAGIFAFMGGFHGMSLGSLSVTGNQYHRAAAGTILPDVTFMPYPYGFMNTFDSITYIRTVLEDANSGIEKPAAIIVETTQAEGGVISASTEWLQSLRDLCTEHDILFICDDIQTGCGRTGHFFSFETSEIEPDIVLLSKSISGYGLPLSLLLCKSTLDVWQPAEHNGTFRGNQLAFVTGTAALEKYWSDDSFARQIKHKEKIVHAYLMDHIQPLHPEIKIRGKGLIWGIDLSGVKNDTLARAVTNACFDSGLILECAGRGDHVLKLLPPLTIELNVLQQGCTILQQALDSALRAI